MPKTTRCIHPDCTSYGRPTLRNEYICGAHFAAYGQYYYESTEIGDKPDDYAY